MSSNSFTLKITVVHVLTILVEFFFFFKSHGRGPCSHSNSIVYCVYSSRLIAVQTLSSDWYRSILFFF